MKNVEAILSIAIFVVAACFMFAAGVKYIRRVNKRYVCLTIFDIFKFNKQEWLLLVISLLIFASEVLMLMRGK
jgi:hypothetical protein